MWRQPHTEKVKQTMTAAKAHYENKLIDQIKDDPKRFWNYTRHLSRSSATVDIIKDQGDTISDDPQKADILNNYFISVLTSEPDIIGSLPEVVDANPQSIIEDFHITPSYIRKKLPDLKPTKPVDLTRLV